MLHIFDAYTFFLCTRSLFDAILHNISSMLKFQLATKADIREAAIIAHKRAVEAERMKRIFNARNRIFGVRN